MFNKLLSNLPYNPSLINQVAFYAKRLHRESSLRRIGFFFVAATMALQVFASIVPAQANSNCDPTGNDILSCGFHTPEEAFKKCRKNEQQFAQILEYYKVSCDRLESTAQTTTINANANRKLKSVGRQRSSTNTAGATTVQIPGVDGILHWRYLWGWGNITPKVLKATTSDNQTLMVMYDCGNLVIADDFNLDRPQPDSDLSLAKTNQPSGDVKPGDTIDYTLVFANKGGTAAFFSVNDALPPQLSYVSSQYGDWKLDNKNPQLKWYNNTPFATFGNTDLFGTPGFIKVQAKVNDGVPSGTTICNVGWLNDVKVGTDQIREWGRTQVCNTVRITCPEGQLLNTAGTGCENVVVPQVSCTYLKITKESSRTKRTFETKVEAVNGATIKSYAYDFGDKSKTETKDSKDTKNSIDHEFKNAGIYDVSVVVDTSIGKVSQGCTTKAIIKPEDGKPLLRPSKTAKNITQKLEDASSKKAAAGDVIEYALTTKNYGDGDSKDTQLDSEDLSDVLQYATLDTNTLMGGVFDLKTNVLSWRGKITIKAGQSITKTFRVTIKNPIPESSTPPANQDSYDYVLTNTYGNTIKIELPKSVPKITEQVTTKSLPNTGPGTSLIAGFSMTLVIGYFFARSRLLGQELDIVKHEYASSAGGI